MLHKIDIEPSIETAIRLLPAGFDYKKARWWQKVQKENRLYLQKILDSVFSTALLIALFYFGEFFIRHRTVPPLRLWLPFLILLSVTVIFKKFKLTNFFAGVAVIIAAGGMICGALLPGSYGIENLIFLCMPILFYLFFGSKKGTILAYSLVVLVTVYFILSKLIPGLRLHDETLSSQTVITGIFTYIIITLLVSRIQKAYEITITGLIKYFAFDDTTGLPTRNILRNIPSHNSTFAIMLVTSFEDIRSMFGFDVAEAAMCTVANRLKEVEKSYAFTAYRLKSNEFGLVFENIETKDANFLTMEKLSIHMSSDDIVFNETKIRLNFVIGFVELDSISKDSLNNDEYLTKADIALKEGIRNSAPIIKYDTSLPIRENAMRNLENYSVLKRNIEQETFIALYQPIVDASNGQTAWYESVVRICNDKDIYVSPVEYLDLSMSTGLSRDIALFMIKSAMSGINKTGLPVSVNLSRSDIIDPRVRALIKTYATTEEFKGKLIVELLESEKYSCDSFLVDAIRELRTLGVKIAIDDFGSGYSNLANFIDLEIDILKIDGEIIGRVTKDDRLKAFITGTVHFCSNANIKTVAEYVDSPELAAYLHSEGIDYLQGYLYGEPDFINGAEMDKQNRNSPLNAANASKIYAKNSTPPAS